MKKNIAVIDESGTIYSATYPKRAKGLVKQGRARFVDDNTLRLARPPKGKTEDVVMNQNESDQTIKDATRIPIPAANPAKTAAKSDIVPFRQLILDRIDAIARDNEHIRNAFDQLSAIPPGSSPGDIAGQAKAATVGKIVTEREATNRELLRFYIKLYEDSAAGLSQSAPKLEE